MKQKQEAAAHLKLVYGRVVVAVDLPKVLATFSSVFLFVSIDGFDLHLRLAMTGSSSRLRVLLESTVLLLLLLLVNTVQAC